MTPPHYSFTNSHHQNKWTIKKLESLARKKLSPLAVEKPTLIIGKPTLCQVSEVKGIAIKFKLYE